jgi:hypothetical protein
MDCFTVPTHGRVLFVWSCSAISVGALFTSTLRNIHGGVDGTTDD